MLAEPGQMKRAIKKRGKCGALFSMARDGRWYRIAKPGPVDESICKTCNEREWRGCR